MGFKVSRVAPLRRHGLGIFKIVGLGFLIAMINSCGVIPPPYISQPSILVGYHIPDVSPDRTGFLFIKSVTQQHTVKRYQQDWFWGTWRDNDEPLWTKAFLCSSDREGGNRQCLMEVPTELVQSGITGFKVSGSQNLAIVLSTSGRIVIIDMQRKTCRPYDLTGWPNLSPKGYDGFDISPAGNEFVLIKTGEAYGAAICNVNGQIRFFETDAPPISVRWNKTNGLIKLGFDLATKPRTYFGFASWASTNGYFLVIDPSSMRPVANQHTGNDRGEFRWVRYEQWPWWWADGLKPDPDHSWHQWKHMGKTGRLVLPGQQLYRDKKVSPKQACSVW
jgi:hypothetical protein